MPIVVVTDEDPDRRLVAPAVYLAADPAVMDSVRNLLESSIGPAEEVRSISGPEQLRGETVVTVRAQTDMVSPVFELTMAILDEWMHRQ